MEFAFVKRNKMAQMAMSLYDEVVLNYNRPQIHQEIFETYQTLLRAVSPSK